MRSMRLGVLMSIAFAALIVPAAAQLTRGLVAYWSFDQTNGNVVSDRTGNGHVGVADGAMVVGNALSFDGEDDRVTVGSFDLTDGGITLAAWIQPAGFTDDARLISKAEGGGALDHVWAMALSGENDNGLQFHLRTDVGDATTLNAFDAHDVEPDIWTHVVVSWDRDHGDMVLYKNGKEISRMSKSGLAVAKGPGVDIGVGNQSLSAGAANSDRPFKGLMDEVGVWERGLSGDEVRKLMNEGVALSVERGGKLATVWATQKQSAPIR